MSISIDRSGSHTTSFATFASADSAPSLEANDPITEVAVLLARSLREDRKQALELSDVAEAARVREAEAQVAEMRAKADAIRQEGWVRGATMALSGGSSMLGGGLAIGKADTVANCTMTMSSGGAKAFEAIGVGLGNDESAAAQEHQAEADLHDARATGHKVAAEKYRDEADEARRMTKKVMDFLENVNQSRNAAAGTAAAIRG
jgi:hypothetical protein